MHPKALLEACSELVRLTLKFDHPADATVAPVKRQPASRTRWWVNKPGNAGNNEGWILSKRPA